MPAVEPIETALSGFSLNGRRSEVTSTTVCHESVTFAIATYVNEFWTRRQRAAHSLHEISYRACFKPQLPGFFIERLTGPGDVVHDPFMGRGTTPLEAALRGRVPFGSDVNPLSRMLLEPRLAPPSLDDVSARLDEIDFDRPGEAPSELRTFYHPETLREISSLRRWLMERDADGRLDGADRWIRMVAVNRLTGHSPGFFSVYTLPPNQAVSVTAQKKINRDRQQRPPRRAVPRLILTKTRSLLSRLDEADLDKLRSVARRALLSTSPAGATPEIPEGSVDLVVTSPPFLDVVDYATDNWLRCWFCGIDPGAVEMTVVRRLELWEEAMRGAFRELARVVRRGGHVAFEVGEVRGGRLRLEESVIPCGVSQGFEPVLVLINSQEFTKTSNCWGVSNNRKGTNTNRVVLFRR